jgi:hypothetical protein
MSNDEEFVWNCDNDDNLKCFFLEIYQNKLFFYFKKIIFDISTSKRSENIKKLF